jgi:hypothetical protein
MNIWEEKARHGKKTQVLGLYGDPDFSPAKLSFAADF